MSNKKPRGSSLAERLMNDNGGAESLTLSDEEDLVELYRTAQDSNKTEVENGDSPVTMSSPNPDSGFSCYKSQPASEDFVLLQDCTSKNKKKTEKKKKAGNAYQQNILKTAGEGERLNKVLLEILQQKLSTEFAIPGYSFRELVKTIFQQNHPGMKIRASALEALQLESEMMLTTMFRLGRFGTDHAKRQTLMVEDVRLVQNILVTNNEGVKFISESGC